METPAPFPFPARQDDLFYISFQYLSSPIALTGTELALQLLSADKHWGGAAVVLSIPD